MADDHNIDDLLGDIPRFAQKKRPMGRPPLYDDPKVLQARVDAYFNEEIQPQPMRDPDGEIVYGGEPMRDGNGKVLKDEKGRAILIEHTKYPLMTKPKPPTVAGYALYLGFADYRSVYRAYPENAELNHIVKSGLSRITQFVQEQLHYGQASGAIFWLKNHGWSDKVENEHYGRDGGAIETKDVSENDRGILKHFLTQHKDKVK